MKSATKVMVSTLGTLAGLAGVEHGVGEMLQGNVAPGGMAIVAWPGSEMFRVLAGEPAMTLVPNLLVTGVLAVFVSLVYILRATTLAERKHGGLVLILLSVVMLLAGAGFGSALLGLIVGVTATRINAPLHLPASPGHILAKIWPWTYVACVASWLLLLPGSIILAFLLGTDNVIPVVPVFIIFAFGSMPVAYLAAFARDSRQAPGPGRARDGADRDDRAGGTGKRAIV